VEEIALGHVDLDSKYEDVPDLLTSKVAVVVTVLWCVNSNVAVAVYSSFVYDQTLPGSPPCSTVRVVPATVSYVDAVVPVLGPNPEKLCPLLVVYDLFDE
jgi:hypothetical protein